MGPHPRTLTAYMHLVASSFHAEHRSKQGKKHSDMNLIDRVILANDVFASSGTSIPVVHVVVGIETQPNLWIESFVELACSIFQIEPAEVGRRHLFFIYKRDNLDQLPIAIDYF